jgi:dTDP-glucose pyrophosphorylase
VEKKVVSNNAVSGVYFFKNCGEFIKAAQEILERDIKTNGEFYVSSAFDLMLKNGKIITCYDSKSIMLGTPEELEDFLKYE